MKKKKFILLVIVLVFCGAGAASFMIKSKSLEPKDFIKWVEDPKNGLLQKNDAGDLYFSLQYKPADYMVLKDLKKYNISDEELKSGLNEVSGLENYTLQIGSMKAQDEILKYNMETQNSYYERIQYLTSEINKDILLVRGKDTLPCVLHLFERAYGLTPYVNIMIGFEPAGNNDTVLDRQVLFQDRMFQSGLWKFNFKANDLQSIPTLLTE